MRVLHVVKTSDGARWAALQAQVLAQLGIEVHVALPSSSGEAIGLWRSAGAHLHILDCSLPIQSPWLLNSRIQAIRQLVNRVAPDLIHCHFVTTIILLRLALGHNHPIPRLFQVPGPLHVEHALYRRAELATAGLPDYWIASSHYTRNLYLANGVPASHVFLSYYGIQIKPRVPTVIHTLRHRFQPGTRIVGNINYMYPPKWYLGQFKGIKRHEDVIDALGIVCRKRPDVVGVLVGGEWGTGSQYEQQLRERARQVAGEKIFLPGRIQHTQSADVWNEFDVAVHVPISENCGGVAEPLLAGVPTIASRVGGLPEVVLDGITGWLVDPKNPRQLADAIFQVLDEQKEAHARTKRGKLLVTQMFDINRTVKEIEQLYQFLTGQSSTPPVCFEPAEFAVRL